MNKFFKRINRPISLSSASVLIAASLAVGFLLGFIRTKLIYANFNDFSTGAYFAAFDIPDLIFYTLSAGALSVAFIPVLSDKVYTANLKQAWRLTSSVLNSISLIMLLISLTLILFPRPIIEHLIARAFHRNASTLPPRSCAWRLSTRSFFQLLRFFPASSRFSAVSSISPSRPCFTISRLF